jgi:hypothetical protein
VDAEQREPIEAVAIELPAGDYRAEWLNVLDGKVASSERFNHAGGDKSLHAPNYELDVALRIVAD